MDVKIKRHFFCTNPPKTYPNFLSVHCISSLYLSMGISGSSISHRAMSKPFGHNFGKCLSSRHQQSWSGWSPLEVIIVTWCSYRPFICVAHHMSVVISIPDRGGGWSFVLTYARISDLPGRSRSDSPQVWTLEITFETDRAQKYCLSPEIEPLQVAEVAQNGVLDRRISTDFRRISALNEG